MKVEQLSVFLENKPGGLEHVTRLLEEANINIRALSLAGTSDLAILRLIVDEVGAAQKALKEKGFTLGETPVVAVEIPDRVGGLNAILKLLSGRGITIEYMYAFAEKSGERAVMVFRFDRTDEAIDLLLKNGMTLLSGEDFRGVT
jgi:hypothetical protein